MLSRYCQNLKDKFKLGESNVYKLIPDLKDKDKGKG